jgi:hypothetical protein
MKGGITTDRNGQSMASRVPSRGGIVAISSD